METLIYGIPKGATHAWQEDLLYGGGALLTEQQILLVKEAATKDGYHSIRVTHSNLANTAEAIADLFSKPGIFGR